MDGALRDAAPRALGSVGHGLLPAVVLEVLDALVLGEVVVQDSPLPGVGSNLPLLDWEHGERGVGGVRISPTLHLVLQSIPLD